MTEHNRARLKEGGEMEPLEGLEPSTYALPRRRYTP
jgi:hypothetical protein